MIDKIMSISMAVVFGVAGLLALLLLAGLIIELFNTGSVLPC